MMAEAAEVKHAANPHEVLLVADALTGQDAVNLARSFDERVGLTGIVLTRVDGDGRGGAALSMRAVTGKPIKLIGTGEKLDALEDFDPVAHRRPHPRHGRHRRAGREGRRQYRSPKRRCAPPRRCARARSISRDLREQLTQMQKMGGMGGLMGMMPGIAKMKNQIAERRPRRERAQAADRDHRLDDAAGAAQSRPAQSTAARSASPPAPAPGRRDQQAAEDASRHGRHDEDDGRQGGKRGPLAGLARRWASAAAGRRRSRWPSSPRKCRAACPARARPVCRRACRRHAESLPPNIPGPARSRRRKIPRTAGPARLGKKK